MKINNRFDKQIQFHCKRILGTVHNGLSTQAEGLLTKVRATTRGSTIVPQMSLSVNARVTPTLSGILQNAVIVS